MIPERLSEDEKRGLDRHQRLRFGIDIRLNRLRKSSDWDHQAEYGAPNHAIFYMAFILMPRSASRLADSGKFYMLVPAIYSEGNEANVPGSAPWLGLDQFGDGVYFSGAHPTLKAGAWVPFDIDVKQLIREGLAAATQRSLAQKKDRLYRVEDYWLSCWWAGRFGEGLILTSSSRTFRCGAGQQAGERLGCLRSSELFAPWIRLQNEERADPQERAEREAHQVEACHHQNEHAVAALADAATRVNGEPGESPADQDDHKHHPGKDSEDPDGWRTGGGLRL